MSFIEDLKSNINDNQFFNFLIPESDLQLLGRLASSGKHRGSDMSAEGDGESSVKKNKRHSGQLVNSSEPEQKTPLTQGFRGWMLISYSP